MANSTVARPATDSGTRPGVTLTQTQMIVVFGTIALGMLLAALDQTVVSTALPTIVGDLGEAGHVSWVVTSYILTQTIATVLAGKLGDQFGRKNVFQLSVIIFLVGSTLSGASQSMLMLISFRALQGIGAGGLTVTATALIADLIPLRQRGKYQGALGAVFGVTTVIGPLLGGVLTDDLSWRWVFYINVPFGVILLVVANRTIPSSARGARPVIDYAGIVLVTIGAGGLVLATSLGGSTYGWTSPLIIGLYAAAAAALAGFVLAERRAADPMLPLRLFRGNVFSVCMILAFVVGFAMLGAMTYLPTYLQYVKGVSPTSSGLRTLPMVVGLMATSLTVGVLVGRTGKYKIYPVLGTAVMTAGLYLLSLLGVGSGFWTVSAAMFVLGLGIGLCMQVLTIIVQNTSRYEDLGVATSAVTFFRTLGSSVGTAVFGAVYSNALDNRLPAAIQASGVPAQDTSNPQALHALPAARIAKVVGAYADTLQVVFFYAAPVAVAAFVISLLLKQVPMRGAAQQSSNDMGSAYGMPDGSTSLQQLETSLSRLLKQEGRSELPRLRAASGSALSLSDGWCVMQVRIRSEQQLPTGLPAIAERVHVPPDVLRPAFAAAVDAGYLTGPFDQLALTALGRSESDKIVDAVKAWVMDRLGLHGDGDSDRLDRAHESLARSALADSVTTAG